MDGAFVGDGQNGRPRSRRARRKPPHRAHARQLASLPLQRERARPHRAVLRRGAAGRTQRPAPTAAAVTIRVRNGPRHGGRHGRFRSGGRCADCRDGRDCLVAVSLLRRRAISGSLRQRHSAPVQTQAVWRPAARARRVGPRLRRLWTPRDGPGAEGTKRQGPLPLRLFRRLRLLRRDPARQGSPGTRRRYRRPVALSVLRRPDGRGATPGKIVCARLHDPSVFAR